MATKTRATEERVIAAPGGARWAILWNGTVYRRYHDEQTARAECYRLKRWASLGESILVVEANKGSERR